MIAITGVPESPRAGDAIPLPALARQAWSAPDASAVLVRLDAGLYLIRPGHDPLELAAIPPNLAVSAAWDRASAGFAACWEADCRAFDKEGVPGPEPESGPGDRLLAYSVAAGIVTVTGDSTLWRRGESTRSLDSVPVVAAFVPGSGELWVVDDAGLLLALSFEGSRRELPASVDAPVALVASLDGKSVFTVNQAGEAAVLTTGSAELTRFSLEGSVEGAWPGPGLFTVRLHDSAKRPLALFNGETGRAGWAPAATQEVQQ